IMMNRINTVTDAQVLPVIKNPVLSALACASVENVPVIVVKLLPLTFSQPTYPDISLFFIYYIS
ncbi:TPA: hypothetical protein ACH7JG_005729, partial [Escherichia coli]